MKARDTIPVSFFVQPELLATLDVATQEKGISRSEIIRLAVIQYLINEGFQEPLADRKESSGTLAE